MKWLVLACVIAAWIALSASQQPSAPDGKANRKTPDTTQADSAPIKNPAQPAQPSGSRDTDTDSQRAKSDGNENIQIVTPTPEKPVDPVQRAIEIVGLLCTVALALVGIKGIFIALDTLKEMKGQREQMGRQVEAAILQVRAMGEQITQMEVQNATAKESADAATLSAVTASRISIPTLKIEKFGFGYTGSASMAAILQYPSVEVVVKNHGNTPAFLRSWTIIFTCEELPEHPVYADFPGSGIVLEKEIIKSGEPYPLPKLEMRQRQNFSDDDIKAVLGGKNSS